MVDNFSIAVVGGGPAGLAAALAAAATGADVTLFAPPIPAHGPMSDNRTAALFAGSIELLVNLGAWEALKGRSAPIAAIRIIDDTGGLLRAPEVVFTAAEVGRETFGWNMPNAALVANLAAGLTGRVRHQETRGISQVTLGAETVQLASAEGEAFEASLVVGADGRNSICRAAAGIDTKTWPYAQAAVTTTFAHARLHRDVSTEFHRPAGPLTVVPMPGSSSSLVWVETPAEAQRLAGLDDAAFRDALERRLQGLLGSIGEIRPRAVFPLSGLEAETFGRNRIALLGEAAHVIPPIGAQGLNLGLRDAAVLADCIADARAAGRDPGLPATLDVYSALRRPDVTARIAAIDVLNRSLISDLVPVHLARGFELVALKTVGPLRRRAIREGLQPSPEIATLLSPGGLARLVARATPGQQTTAA